MAEYIEREAVRPDEFCVGVSCQECPFLKDPINGGCRADDFIMSIPVADVQPVVRCKDCARRPYFDPPESEANCDLVFPDDWDSLCPYFCEDIWYASMPKDNWFCCFGKRKDGKT